MDGALASGLRAAQEMLGGRARLPAQFLTVRSNTWRSSVIVPELPAEIAELKRLVGRFIEEEVYPVEQRIVARNAIDAAEVDAMRARLVRPASRC